MNGQKGNDRMLRKRLKRIWNWLRRESLDELIFGNQAKHKQPIGISWLSVHRLFDYRWLRRIRVRLYLWRKEKALSVREHLSGPER